MRWTNEIHRRGLSVHGPAVKDEIKVCLNDGEVRTSDFWSWRRLSNCNSKKGFCLRHM